MNLHGYCLASHRPPSFWMDPYDALYHKLQQNSGPANLSVFAGLFRVAHNAIKFLLKIHCFNAVQG